MGLRFDDTLQTVLAADVSTAFGKASAWRQIVDLIGRRRAPADARALALLQSIRAEVPIAIRVASARALELAQPTFALVSLCADDDIAVAAPLLRSATLNSGEWVELLPRLSPASRMVVRERRDLPAGVATALASFVGDFAIGSEVAEAANAQAPSGEGEPEPAPVLRMPNSTFVSVGSAVRSIPVVASALERAAESQSGARPAPQVEGEGPFEIADVVARIDAFYTRQQDYVPRPAERPRPEGFRFETDASGVIRWVDGVSRAPLIGLSLEMTAMAQGSGVDGAVAGAFRQRAPFSDARLVIAGESEAAGQWRISANAAFDAATGRFTGYRGTARRPRPEENPQRTAPPVSTAADSMRQLMHELRTPTNAIAGFAEMIEREMLGDVSALYRDRAATIREHARALLAAIDDLDIAARIEACALRLQPAEVTLQPLLTRVAEELEALATARGASLILPETDASVIADPRAAQRLISRLLATLLSASDAGEQIAFDVRQDDRCVTLTASWPRVLRGLSSEALFEIDDEQDDAALLGTGFALRLLRNLALELSGSLSLEADGLSVRLPAAVTKSLEVVR